MTENIKVVALAGGVGGAKLVQGFYQSIDPAMLTIIVNTGDDFIYYGLNISPDLDIVCYTLANIVNPETGWGLSGDTFQALRQIGELGGEDWFQLGDCDIGIQMERTHRLDLGDKLSIVTRDFCQKWGIKSAIYPMSDNPVHTKVMTDNRRMLDFQEYFVHQKCIPKVSGFIFEGIENAQPPTGVIDAIHTCDIVVICPSNPWVSIDPIISIREIERSLQEKCIIAVSPLIGGKAIKGPLSKMYKELGFKPTSLSIAMHYKELIHGIIIDQIDENEKGQIEAFGIITKTTDILMRNVEDRKRLAQETLKFGKSILAVT